MQYYLTFSIIIININNELLMKLVKCPLSRCVLNDMIINYHPL